MTQHSTPAALRINLLDIADVPDQQLSNLVTVLGESETARYERIGARDRRRQFLAGRLLLRWTMVRGLNLSLDALTVEERPQQAPLLSEANGAAPHFSISHSGNWIACAASRHARIGLDIEQLNAGRDFAKLAEHSFSGADFLWWQQQSNPRIAFYRLWSLREAHFKLTQHQSTSLADYSVQHYALLEHAHLSIAMVSETALSMAPSYTAVSWSTLADLFS